MIPARMFALLTTLAILAGCMSGSGGRATPGPVTVARALDTLPIDREAALARADQAWKNENHSLAAVLYQSIVDRDSAAPSVAVFRLATLRAWDNRLDEAVVLFRRYVALEPGDTEGRLALSRALAWRGNFPGALAIYDSVIARDSTYRDAVMGRAQTLAWADRFREALATYEWWIAAHPSDREASIEYARALSWSGQLDKAEALYTRLAATGSASATKGLARVLGWRGQLRRSERVWRQVLVTDPADAEALTGLAQVLNWQGQLTSAETLLRQALRSNPSYGDARTLLRLVQAELRPSVTAAGLGQNDSDDNRATSVLLDYVARAFWWNGTVGTRYKGRWANFAAVDSRADAVSLFGRWQPAERSWQLRAEAGMSRLSSSLAPTPGRKRTIVSGALLASGHLGPSFTIGVSASRAPFDETALLIANGVVSSEVAAEAELALPSRLSVSGAASRARLTGGSRENTRNAFSSTLRWTQNRSWSVAVGARQFGYDTTSSDGYFAPRKYTIAEASGRGRLGGAIGWNAEGDVGIGRQSIEFFGSRAPPRRAERIAVTAGYRFDPAHELSASWGYANVAGPGQTGGSEYKASAFSLRARIGL